MSAVTNFKPAAAAAANFDLSTLTPSFKPAMTKWLNEFVNRNFDHYPQEIFRSHKSMANMWTCTILHDVAIRKTFEGNTQSIVTIIDQIQLNFLDRIMRTAMHLFALTEAYSPEVPTEEKFKLFVMHQINVRLQAHYPHIIDMSIANKMTIFLNTLSLFITLRRIEFDIEVGSKEMGFIIPDAVECVIDDFMNERVDFDPLNRQMRRMDQEIEEKLDPSMPISPLRIQAIRLKSLRMPRKILGLIAEFL